MVNSKLETIQLMQSIANKQETNTKKNKNNNNNNNKFHCETRKHECMGVRVTWLLTCVPEVFFLIPVRGEASTTRRREHGLFHPRYSRTD